MASLFLGSSCKCARCVREGVRAPSTRLPNRVLALTSRRSKDFSSGRQSGLNRLSTGDSLWQKGTRRKSAHAIGMFRFEDEEEEPVGRFDLSNNSSDDELDSDDEMQALGRFRRTGEDERAMFASSPSRPIGIPTMDRWALSERARSGDGGHSRAQSCPVAPQIGSMPTPSIHLEIIPPLELPAGSLDDQAHSFTQTGKAISMLHDAVAASETEGSDGSDMTMAVGPSAAVSAAVAIGATGAQRISSPAPRRAGRGGGNGGAGDRLYATSCPNFTVFSLDSKPGCVDARCARRARSPPRPSRVAATAPAHHSLPSPRAHGSTPPDRPSPPPAPTLHTTVRCRKQYSRSPRRGHHP